ncbi:hypothetical protein UFOVP349_20 [uncultured Caudovirales phage]|uniref:Uncharacterized protein n=1 Tax=uncultured Caudovirales phage TaxID=2100421 RepID=A0A6J5LYM1_9CAUD|nr:hypothetical protein UFOVP349_20 [uncultured Caudovirales phage]
MKLPGFSIRDFCGDPTDERERWHLQGKPMPIRALVPGLMSSQPLFPRWLTRLICAYIAVHTLAGLALLICAVAAVVHFLPLIHRIGELAGVN